MNNVVYYIAKKTAKIRYKFGLYILKRVTPVLYKKIDLTLFANRAIFQFKADNIYPAIRPTINFAKEIFNGKLIKGVEIGVQRGKNSESILNELNIEKLYLIDIWDYYDNNDRIWSETNYTHVLKKFRNEEKVEIIKDFSEKAVNNIKDNSLDFIYIDANHKYKYVYQDIELWLPKVKVGGIIGGHDVCISDVWRAVKDFCAIKNIKYTTEIPDWYFIKTQ